MELLHRHKRSVRFISTFLHVLQSTALEMYNTMAGLYWNSRSDIREIHTLSNLSLNAIYFSFKKGAVKYRGCEISVWVYSVLQRGWNTDEVLKSLLPPQWRCSTGGQGVVGSQSVCGEESLSHSMLIRAMCGCLRGFTQNSCHTQTDSFTWGEKEKSLNMIVYVYTWERDRERNFDLNIHTQTASSSVSVRLFVVTHWKWRNVRNLQGVREYTHSDTHPPHRSIQQQ